jgi:tRNA(adenine34) deaminase
MFAVPAYSSAVDDSPIINPFDDAHFMREALRQARKAAKLDEVPIGAVIVHQGSIIGRAWNQVETLKDATAHAEMLALTQAESALGDWRLTDCDLYVTKEPCPMCAGAIMHCRVRRVIFGCPDLKGGGAGGFWNLLQAPNLNHRCEITSGILQDECVNVLKEFFAEARRRKAEGIEHKKGAAKDDGSGLVFDGP